MVAEYFGLDGCKSGWFYFSIGRNDDPQYGVIERFCEIEPFLDNAKLVLVDIPIGLPSASRKDRLCDTQARRMIGARASSVFPAPARSALEETTYPESSAENFRVLGRKLSKQSWNISHKIHEVDVFLRRVRPGGKIREMHPEVAFCGLNEGKPLKFPKKDGCGAIERLRILNRHSSISDELLFEIRDSTRGKGVATDDILDAMVGAVTAKFHENLTTLPANPLLDEARLPMEIVYYQPLRKVSSKTN